MWPFVQILYLLRDRRKLIAKEKDMKQISNTTPTPPLANFSDNHKQDNESVYVSFFKKATEEPGYVYLFESRTDILKLGFTRNLGKRVKSLSRGNGELQIVLAISGSMEDKFTIRSKIARICSSPANEEWYPSICRKAIVECMMEFLVCRKEERRGHQIGVIQHRLPAIFPEMLVELLERTQFVIARYKEAEASDEIINFCEKRASKIKTLFSLSRFWLRDNPQKSTNNLMDKTLNDLLVLQERTESKLGYDDDIPF